jgi:hypothetical protein
VGDASMAQKRQKQEDAVPNGPSTWFLRSWELPNETRRLQKTEGLRRLWSAGGPIELCCNHSSAQGARWHACWVDSWGRSQDVRYGGKGNREEGNSESRTANMFESATTMRMLLRVHTCTHFHRLSPPKHAARKGNDTLSPTKTIPSATAKACSRTADRETCNLSDSATCDHSKHPRSAQPSSAN